MDIRMEIDTNTTDKSQASQIGGAVKARPSGGRSKGVPVSLLGLLKQIRRALGNGRMIKGYISSHQTGTVGHAAPPPPPKRQNNAPS